ncbi:hypothetical protein Poli38472_007164 [Pythium oligandrum]|uniref:Uncharacterized protein n=1 Tax=Pythium oligandrum TaxID=41045 RepID=A0A8K1C975_PYTOL|nr:hypothetical protein Poli38472_007164 [Pythium oligandrum]|eukprot:TMW59019.1 hypothetical protein Poli38472_007164 [Pythium oligandrum]
MHFLNVRKLRYHPHLAINPVYEDIGGHQDASSASVEPFVLTSALKVCLPHSFLDLPKIISDFIIGDPNCERNHKTAVDRGWVTWLFRFSKNPSKDVEMLTNLRDIIGARLLHDLLRRDGRLYCSKHCLYKTIEVGDSAFVRWHMLNCPAHYMEDWLYAVMWIGRDDILEWMREHQSQIDRAIHRLAEEGLTGRLFITLSLHRMLTLQHVSRLT